MDYGSTTIDGTNIIVPNEFAKRIVDESNKKSLATKQNNNYYLNYLKERQIELRIERQIDQEYRDMSQKLNFELMKTIGFALAFLTAIVLIAKTIRT